MNARWVADRAVEFGPFCEAQGACALLRCARAACECVEGRCDEADFGCWDCYLVSAPVAACKFWLTYRPACKGTGEGFQCVA